jgi:hypothetical protein
VIINFFGHTVDVPSRFINDQPPPDLVGSGRTDAPTSKSEPGGDHVAAMPQWFADFLIERAAECSRSR